MRRGALLNVAQLSGMVPTSVGGGENADGNWSLMARLCGPGSVMLLGFVALIAPCGGSSGLPKETAALSGAAVAAVATPAAAVVANTSRLDIIPATPLVCTTPAASRTLRGSDKDADEPPRSRSVQQRIEFARGALAESVAMVRKELVGRCTAAIAQHGQKSPFGVELGRIAEVQHDVAGNAV